MARHSALLLHALAGVITPAAGMAEAGPALPAALTVGPSKGWEKGS